MWAGRAVDPFYVDLTQVFAMSAAVKNGAKLDLSGWRPEVAFLDRIEAVDAGGLALPAGPHVVDERMRRRGRQRSTCTCRRCGGYPWVGENAGEKAGARE